MSQSRLFGAGLAILGLLSVGDLLVPFLTDGEHPPMFIALIDAALGLVSLAAIYGMRRGSKASLTGLLLVARVLSALSAAPAFWEPGVPPAAKTMAGVFIALTVVGVVLLLSGRRVPAGVR
jgi:hypothetical protein